MGYFYVILLGYLMGCSSMAYYMGLIKKKDIRTAGSGNLGASNATLLLGWKAGILTAVHDIGKAVDHEMEGSHIQLGVELARKYKENPVVVNAIEAHHGDVEPTNVISVLIQAADAVSAARPGARRENVENYIRRLQKLEELTGSYPGVDKAFAIQAGREVRIMVKPEVVTEDNMILLARDIAKKIESELEYPGQIKVNVIRETKAVEYAK